MGRNLKYVYPLMRGSDVVWVQERLIAHGHDPGAVDGLFGGNTRKGVRAFQAAKGLAVDGIVGPKTRAALTASPAAAELTGGLLDEFLPWLRAQLGHIYVWGAQGQEVPGEAWIAQKETTAKNAARAIALYRKRKAEGRNPILAYDCSGLLMYFLIARGVFSYDMAARHIYAKCDRITRAQLKPGDLVFRHNGIRIYHVGVYMGDGQVIESKGRDDGVVQRDINASGTGYWNRYGRLPQLGGTL